MTNKPSLSILIDTIFEVLRSGDTETGILGTDIPTGFHEKDSSAIVSSLAAYLESHPEYKSTTISDKSYKKLYDIYHDITVACSIQIVQYKIGSSKYNDVDFFYKFSTEVLLREAGLLKLSLETTKSSSGTTELEESINNDFEKIGYSYQASNGEILTYIAELANPKASNLASTYGYGGAPPPPPTITQPVFSSALGKSALDTRLTLIPEPYNLAKSISLPRNVGSSSSSFESLNTTTPKIPLPTNKPTTIMDKFLYINWYVLQSPAWLSYKARKLKPTVRSNLFKNSDKPYRFLQGEDESMRSFAPTVDSKGKGVSELLKTSVWLNQVGEDKIKEIRKQYLKNIGQEVEAKPPKPTPKIEEKPKPEEIETYKPTPPSDIEAYDSGKSVNVENLLKWDPSEYGELLFLKKHKEDIKSPKKIQKLISGQILTLNTLRQKRLAESNLSNLLPASPEEKTVYNRIVKLFSIVINVYKVNPSTIPLEFSGKIPVLMTDYSGTLPALPVVKHKPTSTRVPTIRGPYKKKRL